MSNYDLVKSQELDLSSCDREPIHILGRIQPHGLLLVLQEPELTILQVSANSTHFTGFAPEALFNQTLSLILEPEQVEQLKAVIQHRKLEGNPYYISTFKLKGQHQLFDGIVHRFRGSLIFELEVVTPTENLASSNSYALVKTILSKLHEEFTIREFCQEITEQVREMTGFDRVMVYRFDEAFDGDVIAESKREELVPYLGMHYPASDIPPQARVLYTLNWIRLIADVNYQPVELLPALNPATGAILDMSFAVLRSISPIHIKYLQNMGVGATMSISLLKSGKLWGLVACHHESGAKYVPYEVRTACEFLSQVLSLQLSTREDKADYQYRAEIKSNLAQLVQTMSSEERFIDGLLKSEAHFLGLIKATGAAVCYEGEYLTLGKTPAPAELARLVEWLFKRQDRQSFISNTLPRLYPEAEKYKDLASGLIAIQISKTRPNYVLWFRPEVIQTVNWAGNPAKLVELDEGSLELTPRKSFELWEEMVRFKALAWHPLEIEGALELREAILVQVLRQAEEMARLVQELKRSNTELDAFAYIASHDLKEPLRGIHNYSTFLLEDYQDKLDAEGAEQLKALTHLTERMEELIDSLLHFSRVGRFDLALNKINLDELVQKVLEILTPRLEQLGVEVRIPRSLPSLECDPTMVGEIFNNLITNAMKYNDKPQKWIEIGYLTPDELDLKLSSQPEKTQVLAHSALTFYVRDNGIGIRANHYEVIFRIFKRLHAEDKYGGGTGSGLTFVKKIVERHKGQVWLESVYGEGSTFYFTLGETSY
ncbi:MAG: ATP-binding protein [Chloroflexota bacterium]|nr:GAF domain-containing protein [Chloroflexota bacterium]